MQGHEISPRKNDWCGVDLCSSSLPENKISFSTPNPNILRYSRRPHDTTLRYFSLESIPRGTSFLFDNDVRPQLRRRLHTSPAPNTCHPRPALVQLEVVKTKPFLCSLPKIAPVSIVCQIRIVFVGECEGRSGDGDIVRGIVSFAIRATKTPYFL